MTQELYKQLTDYFGDASYINKSELYNFFLEKRADISANTIRWYIHQLKKEGLLENVKRGVYTIPRKPGYLPALNPEIRLLVDSINNKFTGLNFCIWSLDWLNDFTRHQLNVNYHILEVEKDLLEMVFEELRYNQNKKVYLKPSQEEMQRYIVDESAIVMLPFISRSPIVNVKSDHKTVPVPALEKILVDIVSDQKTFFQLQSERNTIFKQAINKYHINDSKLYNYAKRRSKENEVKRIIQNFS